MSKDYTRRFLRGFLVGILLAYALNAYPEFIEEEYYQDQEAIQAQIAEQQAIIRELYNRLEKAEARIQSYQRYVDRVQTRSTMEKQEQAEIDALQEQVQEYEIREAAKQKRLKQLLESNPK